MVRKKRTYTSQEYIQIGMAFFLIGAFTNSVADGRLIGVYLVSLIPDQAMQALIQELATGCSIPILCASIFFNLRGLTMLRHA
jgi:hypothetical protein